MFPVQLVNVPPAYSNDIPDEQPNLRRQALRLYNGMLTQGMWNRAMHFLDWKTKKLLDLQSFKNPTCSVNSHYVGLRSVPIKRIQGSEGRIEDFDNSFNPIDDRSSSRWMSVASVRLAGEALPPVELIQFDGIYFVRDGHHRISVAKALGELYIDAEVIQDTC